MLSHGVQDYLPANTSSQLLHFQGGYLLPNPEEPLGSSREPLKQLMFGAGVHEGPMCSHIHPRTPLVLLNVYNFEIFTIPSRNSELPHPNNECLLHVGEGHWIQGCGEIEGYSQHSTDM